MIVWIWGLAAWVLFATLRCELAPVWFEAGAIIAVPVACCLLGILLSIRRSARIRLVNLRDILILLLPIALAVTAVYTHWPARLHFVFVRNQLDALADMVDRSGAPLGPTQVGIWEVNQIEIWNGMTLVRLEGEGTLVRAPREQRKQWGNVIHQISLTDEWCVMIDD